jgi:NADH:ubiquinone oxidoreductase subunit D
MVIGSANAPGVNSLLLFSCGNLLADLVVSIGTVDLVVGELDR